MLGVSAVSSQDAQAKQNAGYSLHQLQGNKAHGTERAGVLYKRSEGWVKSRTVVQEASSCLVLNTPWNTSWGQAKTSSGEDGRSEPDGTTLLCGGGWSVHHFKCCCHKGLWDGFISCPLLKEGPDCIMAAKSGHFTQFQFHRKITSCRDFTTTSDQQGADLFTLPLCSFFSVLRCVKVITQGVA